MSIRIAAMCIYLIQPVCTFLLHIPVILLFIKSTVYFIAHFIYCTFTFIFLPIFILFSCVCYIFCMSIERTWPDLHSLLIICIIDYVTNKKTLNLEGVVFRRLTHLEHSEGIRMAESLTGGQDDLRWAPFKSTLQIKCSFESTQYKRLPTTSAFRGTTLQSISSALMIHLKSA